MSSRAGRGVRSGAAAVALAAGLLLTGCGGPAPAATSSDATTPSGGATASSPTSAGSLTITVTMTGDDVSPNAEKIDATVGQQVVLQVTSDTDDEVHAHTGGDGYELEVPAGRPTTGTFTLDSPGSFEIESHHREKVIAILVVR